MNDIELKALELRRKAWEVLDGKADPDALFQELYRLERQQPEFFDSVATQLEEDNGRWSSTSALPDAEIKRDVQSRRIEEISFHAVDERVGNKTVTNQSQAHKAEFEHVALPKTAEEEMSRALPINADQLSVIVWRSDFGDRAWIEDFARDFNDKKKGSQ